MKENIKSYVEIAEIPGQKLPCGAQIVREYTEPGSTQKIHYVGMALDCNGDLHTIVWSTGFFVPEQIVNNGEEVVIVTNTMIRAAADTDKVIKTLMDVAFGHKRIMD